MSKLSSKEYSNINSFIARMRSPVKRSASPIKKNTIDKSEKKYNKLPLFLTRQGFYICQIKINGVKGFFLLDTGSNSTCIDTMDQQKFKTIVNDSSEAVSVTNTIKINNSVNNLLELAGVKKNNIKLDILDLTNVKQVVEDKKIPKISGILGNKILNSFKCIIDYNKSALYIRK